jgi:hypothetical protein
MRVGIWTQRVFELQRPLSEAPNLISRLAGAPARLEDAILGIEEQIVRRKPKCEDGLLAWAALDHAGHLADLEDLHFSRVKEILAGAETLTPADMENKKTEAAQHNRQPIGKVLQRFRLERSTFANFLRTLEPMDFGRSAKHPRLGTTLRIIDLCEFCAEHDDHHLAKIHELIWSQPKV